MIVNNEIVGYKYHYECEECDLKEMKHIIFSYFPRYFYQFSHGFSHLVDFTAAPKPADRDTAPGLSIPRICLDRLCTGWVRCQPAQHTDIMIRYN